MESEQQPYGFIYLTTNNINGRKYIGQRIYDHDGKWKEYLGSGTLLRRAIKKYGKHNFSRVIIDTAWSMSELCEKEKFWIDFYNATKSSDFYNIAIGGAGGNTRHGYSQEDYNISEAKRIKAVKAAGAKRFGENAPMAKLTEEQVKSIINLLLDGHCQSKIAREYGVSCATINDIVRKKTWTNLTCGIVFPAIPRSEILSISNKVHQKPITVFDLEMNVVGIYESARAASNATGVNYRLISQVCHGEKKTSHGYIFRFANNAA